MSTVIKIEHLSKKYVIGHQKRERYTALRDVMMHKLRGLGERLWHPLLPNKEDTNLEEFWALQDINFEIKQGDRLGIIGRNGAGKSTLLKIISRITEPTTGRITIDGRVASLLEVGTGFHPELTGRENIFLNGAILGMGRMEIKRKFDEIVDFAEVEKFLDTPVKRYSSGMYVRLAFAVAAHLEPEILIVDEVLAVGDAQFQQKCLGKMEDAGREGRTILFVSHNMIAIKRLCSQCVLLESGMIKSIGEVSKVVTRYIDKNIQTCKFFAQKNDQHIPISLLSASIINGYSNINRNEHIVIRLEYIVNSKTKSAHISSNVFNSEGIVLFTTTDADSNHGRYGERRRGRYTCEFKIPPNFLNTGSYSISVTIGIPFQEIFQTNRHILNFNIIGLDDNKYMHKKRPGVLLLDIPWQYLNKEPT
jgi:lipopolysaccharide transport system ATP-binding protein